MKHYYDQRLLRCNTCHFLRDSIMKGRKACGSYAMAFTESKGIIDEECDEYRTEAQWQQEQAIAERLKKQKKKKK